MEIINEILDFSKLEAGKVEIESVEFNLYETLATVVKSLAFRAHEKNLELMLDIDPAMPDALVGDPTRLGQIITNLVGNALCAKQAWERWMRCN